ncbi:transcription termination factor NusA [Candidatus Methylacidithermus pantelleriae]|uniref:Transcription termination/antitermination protein NusA n=1 Tax=Candidatus Methylacidithermus pantelleriae TaxID=2744239 RepID=A0A8J2BL61_9BACT|nr:transcription termination factor NusA [Candidatus Methylacidithermus pantelleriae]CAF0695462.1 Transcription termination/antitermination protein NusA [Candidatus Methylacidithermus pantelleriae]
MNQEIVAVMEYMEKEKGIKREALIEAMQAALLAAARKSFGPARDLRVEIHPKTGRISARARLEVVERVINPHDQISLPKAREIKPDAQVGEILDVEVTPKDFGRIAAQVFKQTINQAIKGIERKMILAEYKDRVGDVVTGTVRRFERSDVVIDLGKFEAIMPARERVPTEEYSPGERIRAYVLAVEEGPHGPQIILSRSHPDFVRRLLELEVSEVADKTVEIKALAREPGYRTKIAVWSSKPKVDPVGACVGVRGARVKNIVRELNNEKIDIFRWSPNIEELAIEALKPARLKKIELFPEERRLRVTVDEENYSLALGRKGKNAWLATKIVGWQIDIVRQQTAEESFAAQLARAAEELAQALNIEPGIAEVLVRAGFVSPEAIAEADEEDLAAAVPSLDPALIQKIRGAVVRKAELSNS